MGARLSLEGTFDVQTLPSVRHVFDEVVAQRPRKVVVDLEAVELIDSSGIGALLSLCKRVRAEGGDVIVTGARDQPLMVIKVLKLEEFFRVSAPPTV
jgi:anti-sigma B factor antagonist